MIQRRPLGIAAQRSRLISRIQPPSRMIHAISSAKVATVIKMTMRFTIPVAPRSPHSGLSAEMVLPLKTPILPSFQRRPVIALARRPDDVRRPGRRARAQYDEGSAMRG
jgi:hypothetical protein